MASSPSSAVVDDAKQDSKPQTPSSVANPGYTDNPTDYQLLSELGVGQFDTIYRAKFLPIPELPDVTVKIVNLSSNDVNIDELTETVLKMKRMEHPNIQNIYATFVVREELWIVVPLYVAGSCRRVMQALSPGGFEDETIIATILRDALKGLEYLHKRDLIHRDVKAQNLLLTAQGEVKLADFGVAKVMMDDTTLDRKKHTRTFAGTPCWMAPEVIEQEKGYNESADIWSVGITALELAFGFPPYVDLPRMKAMLLLLNEDPPSPDTYERPDRKLSKEFRSFIRKCLKRKPHKRPSASHLLKENKFLLLHAKDAQMLREKLIANLPESHMIGSPVTGKRQSTALLREISGKWDFEDDKADDAKDDDSKPRKPLSMTAANSTKTVALEPGSPSHEPSTPVDILTKTAGTPAGNATSSNTPSVRAPSKTKTVPVTSLTPGAASSEQALSADAVSVPSSSQATPADPVGAPPTGAVSSANVVDVSQVAPVAATPAEPTSLQDVGKVASSPPAATSSVPQNTAPVTSVPSTAPVSISAVSIATQSGATTIVPDVSKGSATQISSPELSVRATNSDNQPVSAAAAAAAPPPMSATLGGTTASPAPSSVSSIPQTVGSSPSTLSEQPISMSSVQQGAVTSPPSASSVPQNIVSPPVSATPSISSAPPASVAAAAAPAQPTTMTQNIAQTAGSSSPASASTATAPPALSTNESSAAPSPPMQTPVSARGTRSRIIVDRDAPAAGSSSTQPTHGKKKSRFTVEQMQADTKEP